MSTLFRTAPNATRAVLTTTSRYEPVKASKKPKVAGISSSDAKTVRAMDIKSWQGGVFPQGLQVVRHLGAPQQIRFLHSDVTFPNMEDYRRDCTKDKTVAARDTEDQRRAFTYMSYGVASVIGLYMSKASLRHLAVYKGMSEEMRAMASIEIKIADIPEGLESCITRTFSWRGKPVFVRHRTPDEIDREGKVNVSELRHPQHDNERTKDPNWVVSLGVCTHLGCVPIAGKGDFSGYYCPCHGSHYDTAGRIRKGPAPLNLEIPPYMFKGDDLLVVGTEE